MLYNNIIITIYYLTNLVLGVIFLLVLITVNRFLIARNMQIFHYRLQAYSDLTFYRRAEETRSLERKACEGPD